MKRILLLSFFTFSLFHVFTFGQSRANQITRVCTGSTTPASVAISKAGNITLVPCSGGTTTITGLTAASPTISGTATFSGVVRLANGTAAAPSLGFTNSSTTGFFRSTSSMIGVATNGVERWTFGDTGSFISTQGTLTTTAVPWLSHSATWNDAGTTHRGIFSNITNTASAADSTLIDLQVGGTSRFNIAATGAAVLNSESSSVTMGDVDGNFNGSYISINDASQTGNFTALTSLTLRSNEATLGNASDTAISVNSATDTISLYHISSSGILDSQAIASFQYQRTVTAAGTTGNRTINKPVGTVNFAAGATAITVTNSTVSTSSIIFPVVRTADATCTFVKSVVPGSGSFVITLNAACTAETSVGFMVTN